MRIAFVTVEYPPHLIGGAGVYAYHLTKELARLGHEVVVFTPAASGEEMLRPADGVRFRQVRVSRSLPFTAFQFWLNLPGAVREEERKGRFAVIHFNGISYGFIKRRIADAPHVLTVHHLVENALKGGNGGVRTFLSNLGSETSPLMSKIEERSTLSADRIVAVSKFTREQIIRRYAIPADHIDVVYNGIDLSAQVFSSEGLTATKARFRLGNTPVILFVGRTNDYRKGLDVLLKAFDIVLKKMDAQLVVAGKRDKDDDLLCSGRADENIIFTGYVDDPTLQALYALCTVYVCPSRLEGFGLTILEAYAAGKPVVATNVGAIPELLEDGKNGALVVSDDPEGMAAEIILFLENPSLSTAIGQANKEYVRNTFSWNECARRLERVYEQL